ncbi:uncharacterized protein N0V96_004843 [Colletotrichum fioriniae]|uniref:uncharacterized protein n=1 Tax=Colletotrichum fioriniae TaxID=710243 RepID=UPI0032D9CFC9|nr:hypothetical protein N0V96_004843 [Colletotrichum fioriniae]
MTTTSHQPPNPQPCPPQHQHQRPRATPTRIFIRLRDRLQLLLERFVDGDTTAQAGFRTYKTHRDARWLAKDRGPASAALVAVSNTNDDEPVRRRSRKQSPVTQQGDLSVAGGGGGGGDELPRDDSLQIKYPLIHRLLDLPERKPETAKEEEEGEVGR